MRRRMCSTALSFDLTVITRHVHKDTSKFHRHISTRDMYMRIHVNSIVTSQHAHRFAISIAVLPYCSRRHRQAPSTQNAAHTHLAAGAGKKMLRWDFWCAVSQRTALVPWYVDAGVMVGSDDIPFLRPLFVLAASYLIYSVTCS